MKITLFIGSLHGGGAERVMCELASYLNTQNHSIELLTVSETTSHYFLDSGISVKTLSSLHRSRIKLFRILKKMFNLYKYVKNTHTDVYVVFLPETIKALLFFRKIIRTPIIVSERCDPASYKSNVLSYLCKSYSLADGIVFQTKQAKQFISDLILQMPPTVVIPNAVNYVSDDSITIKRDKNTIIGVGRFTNQKNFPLLIRAFSLVAKDYSEIKLKIYGEGDLRGDYEKLIQNLNLKERVLLPGFSDNIYSEMRQAGMFVLSSDYEGIPNALIEAMSVGLPCVSTDCSGGGARLLINDGENGLLVPTGDAEKMAEAIKKILDDTKLAKKISDNAMLINKRFSPDRIYGEWEEFICQTVNRYHNMNGSV